MGSCITKLNNTAFVAVYCERKYKIITKKQFQKFKNMEDFIRYTGFFPIARIVSMKTEDKGVFSWDSPIIYPNLEVTIEDLYGMKKTFHLVMKPLYRK
jgi:hypothetical protein